MNPRPPLPPFTEESATKKVQAAEDAWNSRDPDRVSLAYTEDTEWRNRADFINGRAQVVEFLRRKWQREHDYRLKKTLWATADKLRANMDAAEYKHLVLGLIFLKYVSDTFTARRAEIEDDRVVGRGGREARPRDGHRRRVDRQVGRIRGHGRRGGDGDAPGAPAVDEPVRATTASAVSSGSDASHALPTAVACSTTSRPASAS